LLDDESEVSDIEDKIDAWLNSKGIYKSDPEDILGDYWDEHRRKVYDSAHKIT